MSVKLTVQQLLDLPLTSATISISEGDEVKGQGKVISIKPRDEKLCVDFSCNGNGPMHVWFLASECSIELLVGGEILIQEDDCRATIYPA